MSPDRPSAAPRAAPGRPSQERALTILVVDDEPMVRDVTAMMLADEGHSVLEAADGVQALDLLQRTPVDLVITDINMPRLDGLGLAREVQARWPGVRILLVSGRPQPARLPVVCKPFRFQTLTEAVRATTA